MSKHFGDFYRGKTVLVTGHTGFKGSWLSVWLSHLGAKVIGYALTPPTNPCHFAACRMETRVTHVQGDIRDYDTLEAVFFQYRPEVIFHLAAQPIVRTAFREPRQTFEVNLMGTVNVLEAARRTDGVQAVVVVTSDKCYRNGGWEWAYREIDPLGGHEPYSASKACAEIAVAAYQDARFQRAAEPPRSLAVASARAGNVIGGGDWARDRIIPDIVRAITSDSDIIIRSPTAIRPWQHVLESLSGYLWLGCLLTENPTVYSSAWNFGPKDNSVATVTVAELVQTVLDKWSPTKTRLVIEADVSGAESATLRVDSSKARHLIRWEASWDIEQTLDATVSWYQKFYQGKDEDLFSYSLQQIDQYSDAARRRGVAWTLVEKGSRRA